MKARRILRVILFLLAGIFALAWAVGYIYVAAMACAFRSPTNESCVTKAPWELHGEDLQFMVLIPLAILVLLILAGWLIGRDRTKPDAS